MLAGILVGLIIGVGVVVGVTMYMNRSSTPFTNLQKRMEQASGPTQAPPVEVLVPGAKLGEQPQSDGGASTPSTAQPATPQAATPRPAAAPSQPGQGDEGERFDFYKILPGKVDAVPGGAQGTAKADAGSKPEAARRLYLQAGAFGNENEADNLKAKLALLGVEAKIQTVEVADKGLMHRVRIGPFASQADLERVRAELKQNGINADIIKP